MNADNDQIQRELREAESEHIDLEGVLAFAEKIISRPARLWLEGSLDQRQRLQTVFFPAGITFDEKEFGTGATSLFFSMMKGFVERNGPVVYPAEILLLEAQQLQERDGHSPVFGRSRMPASPTIPCFQQRLTTVSLDSTSRKALISAFAVFPDSAYPGSAFASKSHHRGHLSTSKWQGE
jgi:hypothetical protein